MNVTAVFSACQKYRYSLERDLPHKNGPIIGFCLHNPSTADSMINDRTTYRAISFATSWGGSVLLIVNPWAGIATDSSLLWTMDDPVGPENDSYISQAANRIRDSGGFIVLGWGRVSAPRHLTRAAAARLLAVTNLLTSTKCDLRALGWNQGGTPKHPLYVDGRSLPRWQS